MPVTMEKSMPSADRAREKAAMEYGLAVLDALEHQPHIGDPMEVWDGWPAYMKRQEAARIALLALRRAALAAEGGGTT